jgi:hypothetical protein
MRLVRLGVLTFALSATPALACERAIERKDIFVDVKDDDVSVVVVNTDRRCALRLSDWLRTKVGDEEAFPEALSVWAERTDGLVLTGGRPFCGAPGWHVSAEVAYDTPIPLGVTRLAPGEARVKRLKIWRLLDGLDWARGACGKPGLPWGMPVTLRIKVLLPFDAITAEHEPSKEQGSDVLEFVTHPFQMNLPPSPVGD